MFASDKYFTSYACQGEIKSTLKWKRPFFLAHEADPSHGGKPWADIVSQIPIELEARGMWGLLPEEYIGADGRGDVEKWRRDGWFERMAEAPVRSDRLLVRDRLIDGSEPIMWHRLPDVRAAASELVQLSPLPTCTCPCVTTSHDLC